MPSKIEQDDGWLDAPRLAVSGSGAAIAAWQRSNSNYTETTLWMNEYFVGEGWGTATPIGQAGSIDHGPVVAFDGSGNAFVSWMESGVGLGVARRAVGAGWGERVIVDSGGREMALAFNGTGNGVLVWSYYRKSRTHQYASRFE